MSETFENNSEKNLIEQRKIKFAEEDVDFVGYSINIPQPREGDIVGDDVITSYPSHTMRAKVIMTMVITAEGITVTTMVITVDVDVSAVQTPDCD